MRQNTLQTSPYLFLWADPRSRIMAIVDTLVQEKHCVADRAILDILERSKTPIESELLSNRYGAELLRFMTNKRFLLNPDNLWEYHEVQRVEIETSTACNWRCEYCPVRTAPKPPQTMSLELFQQIVEKATRHPSVKTVTLHSYSEPTLDRHFAERIRILSRTRLKLDLFSNGSALDRKKLELLKESGVVNTICFNLPTLDEQRFKRITGSGAYRQTLRHIESAIALGFPVRFSVMQPNGDSTYEDLLSIKERFEPLIHSPIMPWGTTDRAGLLKNSYAQNTHIEAPYLFGCYMATFQLHIAVNGDCFICCEDYHQQERFGNIQDGEIDVVLNSQAAINLRQQIFGGDAAPESFICRRCAHMKTRSNLSRQFAA